MTQLITCPNLVKNQMVILCMPVSHIQINHYRRIKNHPSSIEMQVAMNQRPLGNTGLLVSPIGFGAFKIGRNQAIKYDQPYDLPDMAQVQLLINDLIASGVTYFDTAPAYGLSEERLGATLPKNCAGLAVSTKIGEVFENGKSTYDFTQAGIRQSIQTSLKRLGKEQLDLVYIHSNGDDMHILQQTEAVHTLQDLKAQGIIRAIGFSGKTTQGAQASLAWADALMVEYHLEDRSHEKVMRMAADCGIGVVVKKGLASGRLPAQEAIGFVLKNPAVSSLIVGGLNIAHMQSNIAASASVLPSTDA